MPELATRLRCPVCLGVNWYNSMFETQPNGLLGPEHVARGDAEQQLVADLAGAAGDGDGDGCAHAPIVDPRP